MTRKPKYRNLPAVNNPIFDPTSTVIIGFDLNYAVTAHGHVITVSAVHTLKEEDRFSVAHLNDMDLYSKKVGDAQIAEGLIERADAEMDAWLLANGYEVPE